MNKLKAVTAFFICDIVFIALAAMYSYWIIEADLPVLLTRFDHFLPSPTTPFITTVILAIYFLILNYLGGLYQTVRIFTKRKQLIDVTSSLFIGLTFLFIFTFGIFELFSYPNAWTTYLKVIFSCTLIIAIPRMILAQTIRTLLKRGILQYNAILVGSSSTLKEAYTEINLLSQRSGYKITQVLSTDHLPVKNSLTGTTVFSGISELEAILTDQKPDELILALPSFNSKMISEILTLCKQHHIVVKILPDLTAILEGFVKVNSLLSPPFITITNKDLPAWQQFIKRLTDVLISLTGLLLFLPFFPFVAGKIKKSSPGPIFYIQERIGKNGRPFCMLKLRTMYVDAEKDGPSLSSEFDNRVTPFGRFLRRWRLDEIPQFINVIKGDMALVGPRPERQYYIDQLLKKTPHFSRLLSIKPGITSMGMVKFGYAENLDQMIKRMRYDMIYMENLSLFIDFKIFLYTLKTLVLGEGK